MHVRRDIGRIVERPAANEAHLWPAVLAEDRAAVVAWRVNRLHTVSLDQQVDDEGAAGLTLTAASYVGVASRDR